MKILYKEQIGKHTIIRLMADAVVDNEATKKQIETLVTPEITEEEIENIYNQNLVYAKVGPEAELVDDEIGKQIQLKLDEKGKHQLLLDSGDYLDDYRGVEYWTKEAGKWEKIKIEEIGVNLPKRSVLPENLTQEQNAEISTQQEAERIAEMSEEDKARIKQTALENLADEADRLDRRAKIQQQTFDPIIWYRERASIIELKYA